MPGAHAAVTTYNRLTKLYSKHRAEYRRDHLLDLLLVQSTENTLLFISVLPPGERQKDHEKMNVTLYEWSDSGFNQESVSKDQTPP